MSESAAHRRPALPTIRAEFRCFQRAPRSAQEMHGPTPAGFATPMEGFMNRTALALGVVARASALALVGERDAEACGGCFPPPTQTVTDITDERMLLAVSPTQSTLYDQIEYSGSPANFAWVLPIHGTVVVGLSADVLFDSIDALTATQIVPPAQNCPTPSCNF